MTDDARTRSLQRLLVARSKAPEDLERAFDDAWPALVDVAEGALRRHGVPRRAWADVTATALLAVWRRLRDFRGDSIGALVRWIQAIAMNAYLQELRASARAPDRDDQPPDDLAAPETGRTERDELHLLERCKDELKPEQRFSIDLRYADEALSAVEIAALAGCRESTVNRWLRDARTRLERCLRRHGIVAW